MTAQDFRYAWLRSIDPETAGAGAVAIEAPDDKTLVATLTRPTPFFLGLTSFITYLPLQQEFVEQQGEDFALSAEALLYNGPYAMSEFDASSRAVLKKNGEYWDKANVDVEEINVRIIKEDETALNLYESDQLDVFELSSQYFDQSKDSPEFVTSPYFLTLFLYLNNEDPVLKNENIRKAVQVGFDRQAVADKIVNDGSRPAAGLVPYGLAGPGDQTFREAAGDTLPAFDADQAREYYQRGVEELGEEPTINIIVSDDDTSKDIGTFLQDQLSKNLKARVEVNVTTFENLLDREDTGDYQIAASSWIADYNDPMTYMDLWLSDSPFNRVSFSNARYDELIKGAQQETDDDRRMQMMVEAEKILLEEEAAIGPIYHGVLTRIQKPYVKNNIDHPYGAPDEFKFLRLEGK